MAAHSGGTEYAEADDLAVIARPVYWKGRLAKLLIVAVPSGECDALLPQLSAASCQHSIRLASVAS